MSSQAGLEHGWSGLKKRDNSTHYHFRMFTTNLIRTFLI